MAEFKLGRLKFVWRGSWTNNYAYVKDDVVRYGGRMYVCVAGHTSNADASQGFYTDFTAGDWQLMVDGQQWRGSWAASTGYNLNDIVKYGGIVYICNANHTSGATLEANQSSWTVYNNSLNWTGTYANSTVYKVNDLAKFGANIYICTLAYTSSTDMLDHNKWTLFVSGLEFSNSYSVSTNYASGDIVTYGGYVYIATQDNVGQTPSTTSSYWQLVTTGYNNRGVYSISTSYKTGDVVRYGGNSFVAILDSVGTRPTNGTYWSQFASGLNFRSSWTASTLYSINDVVTYGSSSWVCVQEHTSSAGTNRPDVDVSGNYWNVLSQGDSNYVLTTRGDLLTRGPAANVRLGIGTNGQILRSNGTDASWQTYGVVPNVYYVAPNGNDAAGYGSSIDKPWATINYACAQVAAGTQNPNANFLLTANTGWLAREMYQWMIYQKSISASPFSPGSVFDSTKTLRDSQYIIDAISYDLVHSSNGQTVDIAKSFFATSTTFYNATVTSEMPYFIAAITKLRDLMLNAIGNSAPANNYQTLTGYTPAVTQTINGSYTAEAGTSTTITTLMNIIINALTAQSTAGIPVATTGQTSTIFIKTGTYSEVLPISIPENTALVGDELRGVIVQPAAGYTTSNMFYVRNGTGIRNMSLRGLYGTLGTANGYGTKRPTAGAYVSLDPGTGVADETVWIRSKSPYIQNVSTFGTGCVGLKVDGALHNGGNKSIVANDFTQVLSDGIGVWCTNVARVELVSVFTYYAYMGYLSELGGSIRATNGNNSYGTYGSVAEGINPSEVATTGTVNNTTNQALISNVLVGGGKVLRVEFSYAGQNYSSGNISFSGNGASAAASLSYSNGSVGHVTVLTGGSGYVTTTNNAQSGDSTSIRLATTDIEVTNGYNGMRITIIDGTGYGQTGIITAYNGGTKVASICVEDGVTPGWTSVQGASIVSTLDTTTRYIIEPRVTVSGGGGAVTRTAVLRAVVASGAITEIRILDCGAGYSSSPSIVVTDANASVNCTLSSAIVTTGAISPPTFSNRGTGYTSASAIIVGNGYATVAQTGGYLWVSNMTVSPYAGSNLQIAGDSTYYRLVSYTSLTGSAGNYQARLQVSPYISSAPAQSAAVTFTKQYSNVRLTGHDFLNIGYGNLYTANYPSTPVGTLTQSNECVTAGGGRVFYTSTDQDGNFRVGTLFKVEQATGIATLNADAFNLSGLNSLQLGSFSLGGSTVTITEFSTDPTFLENSDSVLPTQRAIRTFVQNLVGGGGSALVATSLTLGDMSISGHTISSLNSQDLIFSASSGTVTFSSIPATSVAPTLSTHLTNKTYVDTLARPQGHAINFNSSTGTVTYSSASGNTGTDVLTVNQIGGDTVFVSNLNASITINSSGHMIVNL